MLRHLESNARRFPLSTARRQRAASVIFLCLWGAHPAFGCSECGCSLSSDWIAQGYPAMPGFQAAVRFEYYDSSDLRTGTGSVNRSSLGFPQADEIQQETLNRNTWLSLDYVPASPWGLSVQLPFYDRFHSTIAPGDTAISESRASGIGDLRLIARYQKFSLAHSLGFQFGLKLPTGRFSQDFASGPQAGSPLDRGLQLGNGTTDLLAGVSYFRRAGVHLGWFAQILADQPLNSRDGFKPSPSVTFNGGLRYLNPGPVTPQVQINVRWDGRERGANADFDNSGDTVAYVSPGITAELGARGSAFAFVQIPVCQRVNGLQLEPRWLLSVGIQFRR